ncbi:hypothetical protein FUA23_17965 [Neolewinella aurantiaca]|uniref:DUF3887 domain-containing protein n=1 Tax=Neolewinella aurantiaca TaxID=2602767 RepID=A0A5C7FK27_9BACT|nr:hypothetical protein [Neolewinella aurantiaca]TXF87697.1 hypothetical protein FUA23_17965 [Neolewinella aurantiaca]
MNTFKTLTIILLLFAGCYKATAQTEPELLVEKFFATYEESGSAAALDELYATSKWINKATDAVLQLKNKMEGLNEDYVGKYYGYELIVEKKISDSFVLLSYMVKFDRQPIRYTFQFYKPDDKWVTYSFQYDGNLSTELEEAAKIYFLDSGN